MPHTHCTDQETEALPCGACSYLLHQGREKALPHIALFLLSWSFSYLSRMASFPNSALSHPCSFLSSVTSIANNNSSEFSSPGACSVAMGAVQPRRIFLRLHSVCSCACALKYIKCVGNHTTLPLPPVVQFGMQYPTPWLFAHGNITLVPAAGGVARWLYSLPLRGAGSVERAGNSPG